MRIILNKLLLSPNSVFRIEILSMSKNNTEKTRYSDQELDEFKALIEEKKAQAEKQLDFYLAQLAETSNSGDGKNKGLEDGNSTIESERLSTMANRQKKHIQHLQNALNRIENKVFGICRETGKLISKERLRAVPHATLSIEAKQKR